MILEFAVIVLGILHFGVPICYYLYLRKYIARPWNLNFVPNFPSTKVAVVIPTYNEESAIVKRLDNLNEQDYPHELIEGIVVDSGSDRAYDLSRAWALNNQKLLLRLVKMPDRRGKLHDLIESLNHVSPDVDVIVFSDADVSWKPDALASTVKYFGDPKMGAVTASIEYEGESNNDDDDKYLENSYRDYYNRVRIAESKLWSTPVMNGPFVAIRASIVRNCGLPIFEGSDDSAFGSFCAFIGYRAIQMDDVTVREPIRGNQMLRRIRRAQHLIQSFRHTKAYVKNKKMHVASKFDLVWAVEFWLNVINPFVFLGALSVLVAACFLDRSIVDWILVLLVVTPLLSPAYRTWCLQQFYLIAGMVRSIWTKDILWSR